MRGQKQLNQSNSCWAGKKELCYCDKIDCKGEEIVKGGGEPTRLDRLFPVSRAFKDSLTFTTSGVLWYDQSLVVLVPGFIFIIDIFTKRDICGAAA